MYLPGLAALPNGWLPSLLVIIQILVKSTRFSYIVLTYFTFMFLLNYGSKLILLTFYFVPAMYIMATNII